MPHDRDELPNDNTTLAQNVIRLFGRRQRKPGPPKSGNPRALAPIIDNKYEKSNLAK